MSRAPDVAVSQLANYLETARAYYEPQMKLMGLGHQEIEQQSLTELKDSLDRVNRAISHPSQFGTLALKLTTSAGAIIARAGAEATVTIGALPILLERKRSIIDRIRVLYPQEQLEDVQEIVNQKVDDPVVRDELYSMISSLMAEQRFLEEQSAATQSTDMDMALKDIEISERKWRMRWSFLEREPVAILIGAVLLILLGLALIVAMFTSTRTPEVVTSAFLLILGFFFGQTTAGTRQDDRRTLTGNIATADEPSPK
ncbi:hypothetical protein [Nonomuraea sp. bgisy101]|uniref:hypothetical protein n=1 Tax=Nonomuraea sp. bgisy101 TaxID=3413784 RepID=UPI003D740342